MISGFILSLLLIAGSCAAGVVPTAPGPGQSFKEGADCTFSWNLDTTGKWTSFTVDLMSGSNVAMQHVTNVFNGRDGTKGETTYTWKCPAVRPYSAIYFYQFTQAGADTTWTTRFTITSPSGGVTPPPNSVQPSGAVIPWGIGHLVDAGAESASANASTIAPSPGNTTALTTPVTNATNFKNPSAGSAATNNSSPMPPTSGAVSSAPTQSTSSAPNSNPKPSSSSPSTVTPIAGSDKTATPTSGASALSLRNNAAAAFALAAVVAVAC